MRFSQECEDAVVYELLPIVKAAPVVGKNSWTEIPGVEGGLIRHHPNDRYEISLDGRNTPWASNAEQAAHMITWSVLRKAGGWSALQKANSDLRVIQENA